MSIKFPRSPYAAFFASTTASKTLPNGDWCIGFAVVMNGPTAGYGGVAQYLYSLGNFSAAQSLNLVYQATDNTNSSPPGQFHAYTGTTSTAWAVTPAVPPNTAAYIVFQRINGVLNSYMCPVLTTAPTDGSAVIAGTNPATITTTLTCNTDNMTIGDRRDLADRAFGQSVARFFRLDGVTLSTFEIAQLAYGKEITDLGKTPAMYIRMNDTTDFVDTGTQANTFSSQGTVVNGASPGFGYVAPTTPVAPSITGTPTIIGSAEGTTFSYTPAGVSANPTSTRTQQWKAGGTPISGATAATFAGPVGTYTGQTITVTQTETNSQGTASATSPGVVVTTSAVTVDVTPPTAERIYQRTGTTAAVALSGTYGNNAPATIEYQLYAADQTTVLLPWTVISGATINNNTWSGTPLMPQGGMYKIAVRSKDSSGTVLASSGIKTNLFGVGDLIGIVGSSTPGYFFTSFSGTGYTPAQNVRYNTNGTWSQFGQDGVAVQMATGFAAKLGVPVGFFNNGVGGTRLSDQLNTSGSLWLNFANAVTASGGKLKAVITSTGSNDADANAVASRASHLANLRQFATNIRNLTGQASLPILHLGFNRRTSTAETQANYVRMAENDFGDDANVYHVQTLDFELVDGTHMTVAGFRAADGRMQSVFGGVLTGGAYRRGPKITGFTYAGNTVNVALTYRGGSDIVPTTAINGFTVTDGSTDALTVTAARASASQIAVTASRTLVAPVVARYLSGGAPVSNVNAAPTNEVFDNATFPLPMTVETDMATTQSAGADTTAPTLSAASATTTGSTTATGSVTTNEAGGTLYYLASTSVTATAAQVKAGASQAVSAAGAQSVSFTGLAQVTQYYPHYLHTDAAGNDSAVLDGAAFTTAATPDTTAPTLSAATASPNGAYAGTGSVTTNEGNGTLYFIASASTSLTAAQVKAGSTQAISSAGAKGVAVSGLAAATIYYLFFLHRDAAGNDSSVLRSASFTTATAPTNPSTIDATKVPASRTVAFPGNKRVVTF